MEERMPAWKKEGKVLSRGSKAGMSAVQDFPAELARKVEKNTK